MWRNRIIYFILWVLSIVGISFFGGPVSYGLFLMLTFIPVVMLIYLLIVGLYFRVYQEIESKNLIANHKVPYFITLQNETPILFASVKVKFYSSFSSIEGLSDDYEYELSSKSGVKLETGLVCKYRGEYEVGIKRIIITDFLRLFRISFRNSEPLRVIVKPDSIVLGPNLKLKLSGEMHRETNVRKARPDVTSREYLSGDSIKRINWKLSAKNDSIYVRNEIGEEKKGVLILADTCRYFEDDKEYIPHENRVLELVLSLSIFYMNQNIPVTFACLKKTGDMMMAFLSSEGGYDKYYEIIAGVSFDDRLTSQKLALGLANNGFTFDESSAVVIMGKKDSNFAVLSDYLEKSGKAASVYFANPEVSLEESI